MPKPLKALLLLFTTFGVIFSVTIRAQSSNPAHTNPNHQQGYSGSTTSKYIEEEPVQTQEALKFDRAILNTGTQNSGAFLRDKDGSCGLAPIECLTIKFELTNVLSLSFRMRLSIL